MAPEDTTDNTKTPEGTGDSNTSTTAGETQSKTEGKKTYSEAEYKGLQAVIAKRDSTIQGLTIDLADAQSKLKDALANQAATINEKTSLDAKFTENQTKLTTTESENSVLRKTVTEQKIIMQEFPDLAPAYSFIPKTSTEDEFREKAKELRTTLKQLVSNGVQNVLSGSSANSNMTTSEMTPLGGDEEDKAYREVVSLAGRPGKEKEYEIANERYQQVLVARRKS